MDDVAPVLLSQIEEDFAGRLARDSSVGEILERVREGTATHLDTQKYALQVGEASSSAMRGVLTEEALPDGRLYYNIADRTVRPVIEQSHALVNETAGRIQKALNEQAGLGLNPVLPEMDQDRAARLIDKLTVEAPFKEISWLLDEPIINLVQSFGDEFVRANADFQARAGLHPKIVRTVVGRCCDWCAALAGVYDYMTAPEDVYRRHRFCRCTVTFQTRRFMQDVHSKHWYDTMDKNALSARKLVGMDVTRLTPAEAEIRERILEKRTADFEKQRIDNLISRYQAEYGVSHRRAANRVGRALKKESR